MQSSLTVTTHKKAEVIDITDRVAKLCTVNTRLVNVFVQHTTCALTAISLDPGLDQDLLSAVWKMIPNLKFNHGTGTDHAKSHIASSLLGSSLSIPVSDGKLALGQWQRIVLVELDGPKNRRVVVAPI